MRLVFSAVTQELGMHVMSPHLVTNIFR